MWVCTTYSQREEHADFNTMGRDLILQPAKKKLKSQSWKEIL